MKKLKKLTGLLLALVMVMSMVMTVCASPVETSEGGNQLADVSGHKFVAYQIFSGTQADEDEFAYLASIKWGSGVNGTNLLTELKTTYFKNGDQEAKALFADCEAEEDVAVVLGTFGETSENARTFAKIAYKHITGQGISVVDGQTELPAGYYLVVDVTIFDENDTDTYKNLALLQLTKDGKFEIASKVDYPSVTKKVVDVNDSVVNSTTGLQDSADYDIGDHVPFTLTGTIPERLADYDTYKYIFHDTLSAGLTYDETNTGSAKVYAVNGGVKTDITSIFTITHENGILTIATNNIKAAGAVLNSDTKIVVEYTATLNENAKFGYEGNPNTVYLEYSNNPNVSGEGNNETGKTPEDKVIVFTYKLDVTKVDSKDQLLEGAGFTLYKRENDATTWKQIEVIAAGTNTLFSFKGLDDGVYKLVETTVPDGYNKADDIIFHIHAIHDEISDNPQLTSITAAGNDGNPVPITIQMAANNEYYTGVLLTTVKNNEGNVLPETGGMGTTIFYVVGAILVIGAAVIMITRKRMSK